MSATKIPQARVPVRHRNPRQPLPPQYPGGRSARAWRWTAGTGIALVVLAAVHLIAQHFIVPGTGGLRTYHQVLDYIANPLLFALECGFLFAVTIHAMLGLRSVLHDLNLRERMQRRLDAGLWTLGTVTIVYGMILLITLAARS